MTSEIVFRGKSPNYYTTDMTGTEGTLTVSVNSYNASTSTATVLDIYNNSTLSTIYNSNYTTTITDSNNNTSNSFNATNDFTLTYYDETYISFDVSSNFNEAFTVTATYTYYTETSATLTNIIINGTSTDNISLVITEPIDSTGHQTIVYTFTQNDVVSIIRYNPNNITITYDNNNNGYASLMLFGYISMLAGIIDGGSLSDGPGAICHTLACNLLNT